MLSIVEEGLQHLYDSTYVTEYSVLLGMRRELSQHICLILRGVNDCTTPIAINTQLSGTRGRPQMIVNVELVELLRGCGYTWNEIYANKQDNYLEETKGSWSLCTKVH